MIEYHDTQKNATVCIALCAKIRKYFLVQKKLLEQS